MESSFHQLVYWDYLNSATKTKTKRNETKGTHAKQKKTQQYDKTRTDRLFTVYRKQATKHESDPLLSRFYLLLRVGFVIGPDVLLPWRMGAGFAGT